MYNKKKMKQVLLFDDIALEESSFVPPNMFISMRQNTSPFR